MRYCPISFELLKKGELYSESGLHALSTSLNFLHPIDLSAEEQRQESLARIGKMSIQGLQAKISARLKISEGKFELVDKGGKYILKPQSRDYPELPQNEALSMSLAASIGLDVPVHGLLYSKDNSMTYFIKRFDREAQSKKLPVEDFAQLLGLTRDTKYRSSMEQVVSVIDKYCSFPRIEIVKLYKLTIFNFLIGNEDMHLKNFSLITKKNITRLSPVYDLLNTTIAMSQAEEEFALPLNGKKKKFTQKDFIAYFAFEKLHLNEKVVAEVFQEIKAQIPLWFSLIKKSYLSIEMQNAYLQLLAARMERLKL